MERSNQARLPSTIYNSLAFARAKLMFLLVITQCSMRHLYQAEPRVPNVVNQAKNYERRRCDHHTLEEPLSSLDCLSSVVDPKGSRTNKHRYVVASQVDDVRAFMRRIPGVPLVYIRRSVMILEPMAGVTADAREREERGKFRSTLTRPSAEQDVRKRKAVEEALEEPADVDRSQVSSSDASHAHQQTNSAENVRKVKRRRGPKGPNPLSVKKPKKRVSKDDHSQKTDRSNTVTKASSTGATIPDS